MSAFNDRIIEEFRRNDGRVDSAGFGTGLVLLHTVGATTGRPRTNPAMSLRDGDDWLVVASAKGAPRDPGWAHNLRARPQVEIEAVVDGHAETVAVTATELTGDERSAAFERFVSRAPAFADYQDRAPRRLPVFRLSPRPGPVPVAPDDHGRDLVVRSADDPGLRHLGIVGDTYTVLLSGSDTDGRFALIDMHVPPGGGPPPHRHDFEEAFTVLEGEVELTFRGEQATVRAGQTVHVPARAPHFFRNVGDADARMLCLVSPSGLEEYFGRWGATVVGRTTPPGLTEEEAARVLDEALALGPTYAIENLPPD